MTIENTTSLAFIHNTALAFRDRVKEDFGYDHVHFSRISVSEEGQITLDLTLIDDFQAYASYTHRQFDGTRTFSWPFSTSAIPSREQRELGFLASSTNETASLSEHLTSAAGKRFVQDLVASRDQFRALVDFSDLSS